MDIAMATDISNLTRCHLKVPPDHYDRGIKNNIFQRFWHQSRFAAVGKILNGVRPRQILDIGCHGGTFTEIISQKFPQAKVFGIDISPEAIKYGRKRRPKINFQVANAQQLPFPDKSFDLVTCFDTFEHLPDSQTVLVEIKRVLTDNGEVIFLIPTENLLFKMVWWFWTKFGPGRVWWETHIQNFNGHKLDKILEKGGFEIDKRKIINWEMLILIKAKKT